MRAAKARSAERGESLKVWLTRAVEAELAMASVTKAKRTRVRLPLFGSAVGPKVKISNADIERALTDADAEHLRRSYPRTKGSR